ncbi:hypothetical protein [Paenibacillus sp. SYP-B3998]|uniref:hypothetical protein n=1 Tax=Paenibacillus sp. SYP-B3998 TaxID=2678564 RepID=UPI001967A884|nr:hypothetical protein [Paenibacillus sp. SYP-B3998]
MGTRLLSERLIKNHFPHLRYVRIHTQGRNEATIYAWNEDLQLPEKEIRDLRQFASDYLQPYICFKVKSYNSVQTDHIPHVHDLPESIIQTAMTRNLDQYGIVAAINRLFSGGHLRFDRYDSIRGTIHFEFQASKHLPSVDKELITTYLSEMIPLGSNCEVAFSS